MPDWISQTRAVLDNGLGKYTEVLRIIGGDECRTLCEGLMAVARSRIIEQIAQIQWASGELKERKSLLRRRIAEVQAGVDLLAAEKIFTSNEAQRLEEEGRRLEQDPQLQHVCDALKRCGSEYRELEMHIDADFMMGVESIGELEKDVEMWQKEVKVLEGLTDDVLKGAENILKDLLNQVR